jgi:diketogulonate reductase-like aldo/keto reductase
MRLPKIEEVQPLDIPKTWKAMEECVELGLAKAIGVSNFSSKKILDLLRTAKIRPAVNQVCFLCMKGCIWMQTLDTDSNAHE